VESALRSMFIGTPEADLQMEGGLAHGFRNRTMSCDILRAKFLEEG
jgi:hypothetical protein